MAGRHKNSKRKPRGTGKPAPEKDRAAHEAARGKAVAEQSLSQLSKPHLGLKQIAAVLARLREESDRGTAIMGSALVEALLTEMLKIALENAEDEKSLFEDKGAPLATLSNKTLIAHAMGLIDDETKKEIDAIRQIRNAFSHALLPLDFATPEVVKACQKLARHTEEREDARHMFRIGASEIALIISNRIEKDATEKLERLTSEYHRQMAALGEDGDDDTLNDLLAH